MSESTSKGGGAERFCLLTATWSEDKAHFELLRKSLASSALRDLHHIVVVQDEDMALFREFAEDGIRLVSTAEVLPAEVETARRRARKIGRRAGRHWTRMAGSVSRLTGLPAWPRYTGWHTQQLVKLAVCRDSAFEQVVVLDSDVIVTRHARLSDFESSRGILCYHRPVKAADLSGKVANWNMQAHSLFGLAYDGSSAAESYFDTPFLFHCDSVRLMCDWLEEQYGSSWWRVLLKQPARRWSEFATYRVFLRELVRPEDIEWRDSGHMRYLFDASDAQALQGELARGLNDPAIHFLTLHSQSSGRRLWHPDDYLPLLRPLLD